MELSRFYRERVLPRLSVNDVFPGVQFRGHGKQLRAACPLHGGRDLNFAVDAETLVWTCHSQCNCGGDAASYAMQVEGLDFRAAVLELARRAGVDTSELTGQRRASAPTRPTRPPARAPKSTDTRPAPNYPPHSEVLALWPVCRPVTEAPYTSAFLLAKRIDPIMVADLDLLRALPLNQVVKELPQWARYGCKSWRADGYHCIAPMFDARGVLRSLTARNVLTDKDRRHVHGNPISKSAAPTGHERRGLVFACPIARQVLLTGRVPTSWPSDWRLRLELCEGEKKYSLRASMWSDAAEHVPAVIGIVRGSWTADIAARIPDSSSLFVATDQNPAGASYATEIYRSLSSRIKSGAVALELREEFELTVKDGLATVNLTPAAYKAWLAAKDARRTAKDARRTAGAAT